MKINAAVIGSGIGLKHLESLQSLKKVNVKYLCEKNQKRASILKKKFSNIKIIKNDSIIFNDPSINFVSIASYDEYHFAQILKAIKSNKNIYVEKPLCLKFSELKKIKNLLKISNISMSSNLVLRVNSLFKEIKKKISKSKIFYIEMDYIWGRKYKFNGWRSQTKNYNFTLGAAIHIFDLLLWMIKRKPISVTTYGNNLSTKNSKFKKKSFLIYILRFSKDLIVKVSANGGAIYDHFHEIKIYETEKTLIHSKLGSKIFKQTDNKLKEFKINGRYPDKKNRKKLLHDFIHSLNNKDRKHINSLQDIFDTMCICFSAEKSLRTSKEVKIKYI